MYYVVMTLRASGFEAIYIMSKQYKDQTSSSRAYKRILLGKIKRNVNANKKNRQDSNSIAVDKMKTTYIV